jgi:tRNA 2-thiouridine synthesizing protein A
MSRIEVDSRGLRCPLPVIQLATAARDAKGGTEVTLLATDPAARYDVPAWCRMRGHVLREISELTDSTDAKEAPTGGAPAAYLRFLVVIGAQPAKAEGMGNDNEHSSREM